MGSAKHLILPILTVAVLAALSGVMLGTIPAIIFIVAFGGGFFLYMATVWRRELDSLKVIVPYLLTVMLFIAHVFEEYVTDFEVLVSRLAGQPVPESNFLYIAAFMAPFVWVGGAVMLLMRWAYGLYFLCAFFFAMTIAELAHYVFPFVLDGRFQYESGMYTAALPLIPAFYGLYIMVREMEAPRPA